MLTIIHVIDSLGRGGAETLLAGTLNSLSSTRNIVVVLKNKGEYANSFGKIKNCEKIICLDFKNNLSIPFCVYKLRKIIKDEQADIVHAHLFISTIISRLACPNNVQFIFSVHNILSQDAFAVNKYSKVIESLTYSKSQKVIFVSEAAAKDYDLHIGIRGKYIILHNFIEDIYFDNFLLRKDISMPIRLVAVGNLREQKNYVYLLEALSKVDSKLVTLDIYGEGPLKEELQKQIEKYNLPVRLCGRHENIPVILKNYDTFIMTSRFEGFGIALVEAMASGLPLIVSNIQVFKEVTGGNGIFIDPYNVEALVTTLKDLTVGKINLESLSYAGFEQAMRIGSKKEYINKLERFYFSD